MIHYQLQCERAHGFDGWFKDSASFDRQSETGLIACPICSSVRVTRALMAPALGRGTRHGRDVAAEPVPAEPIPAGRVASGPVPAGPVPAGAVPVRLAAELPGPMMPPGVPPVAVAEAGMPDRLRALLQRLRSDVEKNCDYVGTSFADEARRIHHGESEARGIYGETTPAEAEALADEGVAFGVIPWLPRSDS
jgi:hypothetical protein